MKTLQSTAYRQAGHAVAALFHQLPFEQIALDAENCLGVSLLEQYTRAGWEKQPKEQQEIAFIVILAGEMAEKKAAGKAGRRMGPEGSWVVDLLGTLEGSETIARAYYRYLALRTKALLDHPYVWETAEKVARRLLQSHTLDFTQLKCLWHKVDAETGKFLTGEPVSYYASA
ncbi:MAG: hypothetical protein ICV83_28755 [Cytophagales bacterium]|nr:hypothetical protein [Cytophagales bacterium]